tara:strand:+ start:1418 stop:2449 length:1032 start_codon:yes stop_codon:yes gene_type:complete
MSWIHRLFIVSISVLFALILAEIILRVFEKFSVVHGYSYPKGMFIEDPIKGMSLTPNFSGTHRFADLTYDIKTNSLGFFEDEISTDSSIDLLILGDSHTWGYVEQKDRFSDVLKEKFLLNTYNCAVTGSSTVYQYSVLLDLLATGIKPKAVLIGYLPYNDVEGDILHPQYSAMLGYRINNNHFDRNYQVMPSPKPSSLKFWLVKNSAILRLLVKAKKSISNKNGIDRIESNSLPKRLIFELELHPLYIETHVSVWRKIKQLLDSKNIDLYAYVIPTFRYDGKVSDAYENSVNLLVGRLKEQGIEFINSTPFRDNSHHIKDKHMDKRGHLLTAIEIHEFLKKAK